MQPGEDSTEYQKLTKDIIPKNETEIEAIKNIPYREVLGSVMYIYQATRPDLGCAISTLGSFAENPGKAHWYAVKCLCVI